MSEKSRQQTWKQLLQDLENLLANYFEEKIKTRNFSR
jgi:hypothetical protein